MHPLMSTMQHAKTRNNKTFIIHFLIRTTSYYADPVIIELPRMSGGSPLHPQMEPILVAGERLYSQFLVLLGQTPWPVSGC